MDNNSLHLMHYDTAEAAWDDVDNVVSLVSENDFDDWIDELIAKMEAIDEDGHVVEGFANIVKSDAMRDFLDILLRAAADSAQDKLFELDVEKEPERVDALKRLSDIFVVTRAKVMEMYKNETEPETVNE